MGKELSFVAHYGIELHGLTWPCMALHGFMWSFMVFVAMSYILWYYIAFSCVHRSKFIWSCSYCCCCWRRNMSKKWFKWNKKRLRTKNVPKRTKNVREKNSFLIEQKMKIAPN